MILLSNEPRTKSIRSYLLMMNNTIGRQQIGSQRRVLRTSPENMRYHSELRTASQFKPIRAFISIHFQALGHITMSSLSLIHLHNVLTIFPSGFLALNSSYIPHPLLTTPNQRCTPISNGPYSVMKWLLQLCQLQPTDRHA